MGRLDIRICAARNLVGKPDPYVVVKLENQTYRTGACKDTSNPTWNEVFKFQIADPNSSQLKFELWNKNVIADEFLGQYSLSCSGLVRGQVNDQWYILQQCKTNAELHIRVLAHDFGIELPNMAVPPPNAMEYAGFYGSAATPVVGTPVQPVVAPQPGSPVPLQGSGAFAQSPKQPSGSFPPQQQPSGVGFNASGTYPPQSGNLPPNPGTPGPQPVQQQQQQQPQQRQFAQGNGSPQQPQAGFPQQQQQQYPQPQQQPQGSPQTGYPQQQQGYPAQGAPQQQQQQFPQQQQQQGYPQQGQQQGYPQQQQQLQGSPQGSPQMGYPQQQQGYPPQQQQQQLGYGQQPQQGYPQQQGYPPQQQVAQGQPVYPPGSPQYAQRSPGYPGQPGYPPGAVYPQQVGAYPGSPYGIQTGYGPQPGFGSPYGTAYVPPSSLAAMQAAELRAERRILQAERNAVIGAEMAMLGGGLVGAEMAMMGMGGGMGMGMGYGAGVVGAEMAMMGMGGALAADVVATDMMLMNGGGMMW